MLRVASLREAPCACAQARRGVTVLDGGSTAAVGTGSVSIGGTSARLSGELREIVTANENSSAPSHPLVRVRAQVRTRDTFPPPERGELPLPDGRDDGTTGWRLAVLHAAECAQLLAQTECAGRLLAATTARDGLQAAAQTETVARSVVAAARAMLGRVCDSLHLRLLAEAADLARRAALEARLECLLATAAADP